MAWKTRFPIRRRSPSSARTRGAPASCVTNTRAISTGGASARDILAQEKANYVVMMMGVSDHQNISERDLAKEADKKAKTQGAKSRRRQRRAAQDRPDEPGSSIIAPEPKAKTANGVVEFRSDKWAEIYSRRIDATIAALKSKGVPVFWVGLPAIRGHESDRRCGLSQRSLSRPRRARRGDLYRRVGRIRRRSRQVHHARARL